MRGGGRQTGMRTEGICRKELSLYDLFFIAFFSTVLQHTPSHTALIQLHIPSLLSCMHDFVQPPYFLQ